MLSVSFHCWGVCSHSLRLLHVLDLDPVETQKAVAVFTEVLRIQLRGILA